MGKLIQLKQLVHILISALFQYLDLFFIDFIQLKTPYKADLNTKTAVVRSTLNTKKYAVINRNPVGRRSPAVEAVRVGWR